jgi:hypothetical protein
MLSLYRFKPEADAVLKDLVGKSSVSRDYTFVRRALSSSEAVCGKRFYVWWIYFKLV